MHNGIVLRPEEYLSAHLLAQPGLTDTWLEFWGDDEQQQQQLPGDTDRRGQQQQSQQLTPRPSVDCPVALVVSGWTGPR